MTFNLSLPHLELWQIAVMYCVVSYLGFALIIRANRAKVKKAKFVPVAAMCWAVSPLTFPVTLVIMVLAWIFMKTTGLGEN